MPMLPQPIKCLHLAIKDTLVPVDVYMCVLIQRILFLASVCFLWALAHPVVCQK